MKICDFPECNSPKGKGRRHYCDDHAYDAKSYNRRYYVDNREKELERRREYRSSHLDDVKATNHRWFAEHPEYKKNYYEANKDAWREYVADYRGAKLDNQCGHSDCKHIDRRSVWGRDEGHCRIGLVCNGDFITFDEMHLDHVIPVSKGGPHCYANVQTACAPCNLAKGARLEVCG